MKKHILHILILAFVSTTITIAQTPNWKWARSAAGGEYDESSTIATDASGNIIIAGYFASDSITIGSINLQNAGIGFDDAFIAKYGNNSTASSLISPKISGINFQLGNKLIFSIGLSFIYIIEFMSLIRNKAK